MCTLTVRTLKQKTFTILQSNSCSGTYTRLVSLDRSAILHLWILEIISVPGVPRSTVVRHTTIWRVLIYDVIIVSDITETFTSLVVTPDVSTNHRKSSTSTPLELFTHPSLLSSPVTPSLFVRLSVGLTLPEIFRLSVW